MFDRFAALGRHHRQPERRQRNRSRRAARSSPATSSSCSACAPSRAACSPPADDVTPGAHPVAVISHRLWQTRFAGRADIVGAPDPAERTVFTIVGVTPAGFPGPAARHRARLYVPMMMQALMRPPRAGIFGRAESRSAEEPGQQLAVPARPARAGRHGASRPGRARRRWPPTFVADAQPDRHRRQRIVGPCADRRRRSAASGSRCDRWRRCSAASSARCC